MLSLIDSEVVIENWINRQSSPPCQYNPRSSTYFLTPSLRIRAISPFIAAAAAHYSIARFHIIWGTVMILSTLVPHIFPQVSPRLKKCLLMRTADFVWQSSVAGFSFHRGIHRAPCTGLKCGAQGREEIGGFVWNVCGVNSSRCRDIIEMSISNASPTWAETT